MSRLPPALARRVDRAAHRAHRHHRLAHHPLCAAYAPERFRIGRHHLCRGCTMVGIGTVAGLASGFAIPPLPLGLLLPVAVTGAALGILALARRVPLPGKLPSRALPAAFAAYVFTRGLIRGGPEGFAIAATTAILVAVGILLYRRRGPFRAPCRTCPERELAPCSGFRLAWERERAFRRLAGRWIAATPIAREATGLAEGQPH